MTNSSSKEMDAANHGLIINHTRIRAFDTFNEQYSAKAIEICQLLKEFQIYLVLDYDSQYFNSVNMEENDPFGYYIEVKTGRASDAIAEIMVNKTLCERLELTAQEMLAAVAHEVGHIMFYFHTEKEKWKGIDEEMICDEYVCRMGLKDEMVSLLKKMIDSGKYELEQTFSFRQRIDNINYE